jgi:hypothetical protein
MGTVLRARAGRTALVLAVLAGVGTAWALPAAASPQTPHRGRPAVPGVAPSVHSGDREVVLGPAVKYARGADGSVVRVR